jgi:hypothetical protein
MNEFLVGTDVILETTIIQDGTAVSPDTIKGVVLTPSGVRAEYIPVEASTGRYRVAFLAAEPGVHHYGFVAENPNVVSEGSFRVRTPLFDQVEPEVTP